MVAYPLFCQHSLASSRSPEVYNLRGERGGVVETFGLRNILIDLMGGFTPNNRKEPFIRDDIQVFSKTFGKSGIQFGGSGSLVIGNIQFEELQTGCLIIRIAGENLQQKLLSFFAGAIGFINIRQFIFYSWEAHYR